MTDITLTAVADAQVSSAGTNGTSTTINIGENAYNERYYGVFKFDLSSIPAGSVITRARLNLRLESWASGSSGGMWDAQRITSDWTEAAPGTAGNVTSDGSAWASGIPNYFDIKEMAQGWLDGKYPNYGVHLSLREPDGNRLITVTARENATTTYRPMLEISYGDTNVVSADEYNLEMYSEGNQKATALTSDGTIWTVHPVNDTTGFALVVSKSKDNGRTWTFANRVVSLGGNSTLSYYGASLFIDKDDYAHVVYQSDTNAGQQYYMRGTPNADRTSFTWSTNYSLSGLSSGSKAADIVAHREGTGWVAHVVSSWTGTISSAYTMQVKYYKITIDNAGAITVGSPADIFSQGSGNAGHTYPSIDFKHNGDGKTVDGNPDLYVVYNHRSYSSSPSAGTVYIKGTYSSGNWTWGSPVRIDTAQVYNDTLQHIRGWYFNGKVWAAGYLDQSNGTAASDVATPFIASVDVATNTPTIHYKPSAYGVATPAAERLSSGSSTRDGYGNVYIFGRAEDGTANARKLQYRKFNVSIGQSDPPTVIDSSVRDTPKVNANFASGFSKIDFTYAKNNSGSYYVLKSGGVNLNAKPNAPTGVSVSGTPRAGKQGATVSWTHNDPEGDLQTKYKFRWRKIT